MLLRLISNFWAQAIHLYQSCKVLGLQVRATPPGLIYKTAIEFLPITLPFTRAHTHTHTTHTRTHTHTHTQHTRARTHTHTDFLQVFPIPGNDASCLSQILRHWEVILNPSFSFLSPKTNPSAWLKIILFICLNVFIFFHQNVNFLNVGTLLFFWFLFYFPCCIPSLWNCHLVDSW